MLEIVEYGKDEYGFPALVVLGCFDAIHAGHRELLKKAKLQAKINGLDLGVMMFKEGKNGKLIYSFQERCALLEQYNVKFVLAVDFNDEFKKIAPLDFLSVVEDKINVKAYMSGKDFRFGANAKGKSSTLKNYAEDEENGVWYMPVKDIDMNGEKISTTLIKSCLDAGDVAKANLLLGSEFSVSGEVVKGEGRGTSVVGFPTVNIVYPEWKHPVKHGVYSVKCLIGDTDYQGIANFGNCPTFGDDRIALEVYLEGFSGDLYGQVLTIRFIDFIRNIEEFGSAEELSGQLQSDLQSVTDELAATADEQPAEIVAEVVEEPVAEQPVEEKVEDIVENNVDEEVAEVVAEQPEEPIEEPVCETVEEEAEQLGELVDEQPAEEVVEEIEVQTEEAVADGVGEEQPAEEIVEEEVAAETAVAEQPDDIVVGEINELPEETFVEETVEQVEEAIVEEGFEEISDDGFDEMAEVTETEELEETAEELPEQTVIEGVAAEMQYSEGESESVEEPLIEETEHVQTENGEQLDFIDEVIAETEEVAEETENEDNNDGNDSNDSETTDGETD